MSKKIGQVFLKKKGQFKKKYIRIYYTANIQITELIGFVKSLLKDRDLLTLGNT